MTTTPASIYLATIDAIVVQMKVEITDDIAAGIVPEAVATFSELHNFVDANTYALDHVATLAKSRDWIEFVNDASYQIDVWLRAHRPADVAAQQTGSSWHESTPIHLGEQADTLPPVTVADRAARVAAFQGLPTVYASTAAHGRRVALRTDESFRDPDGTVRVALIEEGKRGYVALSGFADLAAATAYADRRNAEFGLSAEEVLTVYASSLAR